MVQLENEFMYCVSTRQGFLKIYDIRKNMVVDIFRLNGGSDKDYTEIHCIQPHLDLGQKKSTRSDMLITASFGDFNN